MHRILPILLLFAAACATAPATPPASGTTATLESTPRHHEWVEIASAGRPLHAYVAWPERSDAAPAVLVIHENRGLTDWVRTVADQLASQGYLAIAPDMLSGTGPGGGRTSSYPSEDAAREGISKLDISRVATDMQNAAQYIRTRPGASGTLYVAGFCWGGSRAWEAANQIDGLSGTFVFYGTGPQEAAGVRGIDAPVWGFYGGDDARVNATIDHTAEHMREEGKVFDPVIYPGAGHAFMRLGEQPDAKPANREARDRAWQRWLGAMR